MNKNEHVLKKIKKIIRESIEDFNIYDIEQSFLQKLNEGLIKTEPIEYAVDNLRMFLIGNDGIKFDIGSNLEKNRINLRLYNFFTNQNISGIISRINMLGYFPSYYQIGIGGSNKIIEKNYNILDLKADLEQIDNYYRYIYFIIESKFDKKPDMKPDRAYHVTRFLALNKILKNGLSPRANKSSHLERVYFTESAVQAALYAAQLRQRYQIQPNDYYAILEIKGGCLGEITIYEDPNFEGAYYTYSNIKPECLTQFNPSVKL